MISACAFLTRPLRERLSWAFSQYLDSGRWPWDLFGLLYFGGFSYYWAFWVLKWSAESPDVPLYQAIPLAAVPSIFWPLTFYGQVIQPLLG